MNKWGVVYIVDKVFHDLLKFSLNTLRQIPEHASLPVTIYTFDDLDTDFDSDLIQVRRVKSTIDGISLGSEPNRRHGLLLAGLYAGLSPYDITLYLDADTLVFRDLSPLFKMVEQQNADVAAVSEPYFPDIEPLRFFFGWSDSINESSAFRRVSEILEIDYPAAVNVPYFNAGVLCGRKGNWASEWLRLLRKLEDASDINSCDNQLPLQAALIRTRSKHLHLSPAWNFSFRSQTEINGERWDISYRERNLLLHSPTGEIEPLRIFHAIGAIHWMPSVLAFPPNLLYIDAIRKIAVEQENG